MAITSVTSTSNPFTPSLGQSNVVTIKGLVLVTQGANGNKTLTANLSRRIIDVATGQTVGTFTASAPIPSPTRTMPQPPFSISSAWSGVGLSGSIASAGGYRSDITAWIEREPQPGGGYGAPPDCGPNGTLVNGPCKLDLIQLPQYTVLLWPLPPQPPGGFADCGHRQELCNGLDDNCDGRIDEFACDVVTNGCNCTPHQCGALRCTTIPDGCGLDLPCPCP